MIDWLSKQMRLDEKSITRKMGVVSYDHDSQPTPFPSPSKSCGSGGNTSNLLSETSPQFRSGGKGDMQTPGYDGSQLAS